MIKLSETCYVRDTFKIYCVSIAQTASESYGFIYNIELQLDEKIKNTCSGDESHEIIIIGQNMTKPETLFAELAQIGTILGFREISPWLWIRIRHDISVEYVTVEDYGDDNYPIIARLSNNTRHWLGCNSGYQSSIKELAHLKLT